MSKMNGVEEAIGIVRSAREPSQLLLGEPKNVSPMGRGGEGSGLAGESITGNAVLFMTGGGGEVGGLWATLFLAEVVAAAAATGRGGGLVLTGMIVIVGLSGNPTTPEMMAVLMTSIAIAL